MSSRRQNVDFETYVASINRMAADAGLCSAGQAYCAAVAWRDFYEDGVPAADAWEMELYARRS